MNPMQRNAMASELFATPDRLQEQGAWDAFNDALNSLARYSFNKADELATSNPDAVLTRTHVYLDLFAQPGRDDGETRRNVVRGRFRTPDRQNPFLLELKKYVGLVYNTNLPDYLKRYTFTPAGMPTRIALQDASGFGRPHSEFKELLSDDEAVESIRRAFMAYRQHPMSLPLLSDLSVHDVLEIRALPEWSEFMTAQVLAAVLFGVVAA